MQQNRGSTLHFTVESRKCTIQVNQICQNFYQCTARTVHGSPRTQSAARALVNEVATQAVQTAEGRRSVSSEEQPLVINEEAKEEADEQRKEQGEVDKEQHGEAGSQSDKDLFETSRDADRDDEEEFYLQPGQNPTEEVIVDNEEEGAKEQNHPSRDGEEDPDNDPLESLGSDFEEK